MYNLVLGFLLQNILFLFHFDILVNFRMYVSIHLIHLMLLYLLNFLHFLVLLVLMVVLFHPDHLYHSTFCLLLHLLFLVYDLSLIHIFFYNTNLLINIIPTKTVANNPNVSIKYVFVLPVATANITCASSMSSSPSS